MASRPAERPATCEKRGRAPLGPQSDLSAYRSLWRPTSTNRLLHRTPMPDSRASTSQIHTRHDGPKVEHVLRRAWTHFNQLFGAFAGGSTAGGEGAESPSDFFALSPLFFSLSALLASLSF